MSISGAVVTYIAAWFVVFLLILPRGQATQGEAGEIEPGTPASAPAQLNMPRKILWTSIIAVLPVAGWAVIMATDALTLGDFDFLFPASFKEAPVGR